MQDVEHLTRLTGTREHNKAKTCYKFDEEQVIKVGEIGQKKIVAQINDTTERIRTVTGQYIKPSKDYPITIVVYSSNEHEVLQAEKRQLGIRKRIRGKQEV